MNLLLNHSISRQCGGSVSKSALNCTNLLNWAPLYLTPLFSFTVFSLSLSGSPGIMTGVLGSAGSRPRKVLISDWSLTVKSSEHTPGSRTMKQWLRPPGWSLLTNDHLIGYCTSDSASLHNSNFFPLALACGASVALGWLSIVTSY